MLDFNLGRDTDEDREVPYKSVMGLQNASTHLDRKMYSNMKDLLKENSICIIFLQSHLHFTLILSRERIRKTNEEKTEKHLTLKYVRTQRKMDILLRNRDDSRNHVKDEHDRLKILFLNDSFPGLDVGSSLEDQVKNQVTVRSI